MTPPFGMARVSLTIPSALGSAPTTAKDKPGRVTATSHDGELEANQPTVSGRTINVAIKQLDIGESVTIKYGTDEDEKESEKAVLHYVANDAISVRGTFRVSSSANTQTTRSVTIKLNNIADGTGSATLSPTSVEAGSNNRVIQVTFTAAGTMNGGKVSLEIPSGEWGLMQDDPTKRNYVTVRGSGGVSLESVNGTSAVATIRTLAKGGSFHFIYGGGTSSANNGVEVQNDPGITAFTINSDGDGDGVFAPVESDVKHEGREKTRNPKKLGRIYADAPGKLQIEVSGAADGTGTVTVEPAEVRAAADDVRLVFTYTPTQTILDGELRFTVPSGWSKPQVEDLGSRAIPKLLAAVSAPLRIMIDLLSLYLSFPLTKHRPSQLLMEQPKRVWLLPLPQRAPIPSGLKLREVTMVILNPFKGSPLCRSAVKQVAAEKRY